VHGRQPQRDARPGRGIPQPMGLASSGGYIKVHMGPTENVAVGIMFSILSKLSLTKWTSDFKQVLHRTAKQGNNNASTNTQESHRADYTFTISHMILFSATS